MMPGRLGRPIIMSFLFLPNGSFSPKYHLFDSALLSRIVFISTGQDPAINWDFGPKRRPQFKNKKKGFTRLYVYSLRYHFGNIEIEHVK